MSKLLILCLMLSQTSAYYSKACLSINMLVFYIIFITKNNKSLYAIEIMLSQKMTNKICLRIKFEIENKIKTELLGDLTIIYSCACTKPSLIRLHVSSSMKTIFSSSAKSILTCNIAISNGRVIL